MGHSSTLDIHALLDRSDEFEARLHQLLGDHHNGTLPLAPRARATVSTSRISTEHASALRLLFRSARGISATALLRSQYEALIRATWLTFSASDREVERLTDSLSSESELAAKNLPSTSEMLRSLDGPAPSALLEPLRQFRAVSWHSLNSYVHAGIHPIARSTTGFPQALAMQVIRNSNGLLHLALRLQASFADQATMDRMAHARDDFEDCSA